MTCTDEVLGKRNVSACAHVANGIRPPASAAALVAKKASVLRPLPLMVYFIVTHLTEGTEGSGCRKAVRRLPAPGGPAFGQPAASSLISVEVSTRL
jgi:hypothetical protein